MLYEPSGVSLLDVEEGMKSRAIPIALVTFCASLIQCGGQVEDTGVSLPDAGLHDGKDEDAGPMPEEGGPASCDGGTFMTPSGCLTCQAAHAIVQAAALAAVDEAQQCSPGANCVLSPPLKVSTCFKGCPVPVVAAKLPALKNLLADLEGSEYCACDDNPPDCVNLGAMACVDGRCQFL